MKKVVLFAICVAFEHSAFALHNSGKALGWTAGWSWDGSLNSNTFGAMSDEDLVKMLYTRPGRSNTDHPTFEQRLQYKKMYEVNEDPEADWDGDQQQIYSPPNSQLQSTQDYYSYPDNGIGYDAQPGHSSSSSTYMTSSHGDGLQTAYSHKIIHNKK